MQLSISSGEELMKFLSRDGRMSSRVKVGGGWGVGGTQRYQGYRVLASSFWGMELNQRFFQVLSARRGWALCVRRR